MGKNNVHQNVISDYDFVRNISKQLADYYKKAISFNVSECYPDALTNYRKGLSVIVSLTSNALNIESDDYIKNLDDRIQKLADSSRIHYNSIALMDKIRKAGNKGTHSEDYPEEDFLQLSGDTQAKFLELIAKLYALISNVKTLPNYECRLKNELSIATLSHKALFENDSNAQYFIARKLNLNAQRIVLGNTWGEVGKHTEVDLPNGDKETRYHNQESTRDTLIAYQLFHACQFDVPEALYEYGRMLLVDGHWLSEGVESWQAVSYIQRASGVVVEASSLLGRICLHGLYGRTIDVEWALELLEEAATQGDSKAALELANYYLGQKNNVLSLEYFKLASEYGSPKAQLLLAKYLIEGVLIAEKEFNIDQLLSDAWDAGVDKARLYQARRLSLQSGGDYCKDAQLFYEEYAQKNRSAIELLECAQYLIKYNKKTYKAHQYLMTAQQVSYENKDRKLNAFLSYVLDNITIYSTDNPKERFIYNFPPEVLLKPERVDINELLIRNAFLISQK